jgi:hypothetical protein
VTKVIPSRPAASIYTGPLLPSKTIDKRALSDMVPAVSSLLHKIGEDLKDFASGQ